MSALVCTEDPGSEGHYVAGKLGLPPGPGMTQGKEGLISPEKHHPHFPLHMYALSGSHLTSSKSHRDEPAFSSSKEEADLVTCQSKLWSWLMLCVQTGTWETLSDIFKSMIITDIHVKQTSKYFLYSEL
jgi:hypothetical protein